MSSRCISISRVIDASAAEIFHVLRSPALHLVIDGSEMVRGLRHGPDQLELGSKFGMRMRQRGVPYKISNVVVEFEPDRLIAWRHFAGHRWRYELEEVAGGTKVTETFDWSTSLFPKGIELMGYPERNRVAIEQTLDRLAAHVTQSP